MNTTTPAAAPLTTNGVLVGSIAIRILVHAEIEGAYFVQARDVRFFAPRVENLDTALALLGCKPAATPVVGGMFAGVALTADEAADGSALLATLIAGVEAWKAAQTATTVTVPTFEAALQVVIAVQTDDVAEA